MVEIFPLLGPYIGYVKASGKRERDGHAELRLSPSMVKKLVKTRF